MEMNLRTVVKALLLSAFYFMIILTALTTLFMFNRLADKVNDIENKVDFIEVPDYESEMVLIEDLIGKYSYKQQLIEGNLSELQDSQVLLAELTLKLYEKIQNQSNTPLVQNITVIVNQRRSTASPRYNINQNDKQINNLTTELPLIQCFTVNGNLHCMIPRNSSITIPMDNHIPSDGMEVCETYESGMRVCYNMTLVN